VRTRSRSQRGEAVTEVVLVVPVLMVLVLAVIQFGLWFHAVHVAEAAAQEGVRAARVLDGTAEVGRQRAEAFMAANAPTLVPAASVTATRNTDWARVEVKGRVRALVPGLDLAVRSWAESPTERFRAP
jgi:Flp pilus assembly protein TadG